MQRRTTTLQIQKAMKSNYLHLIKAEVYNKSTRKTEVIPNDKFLECFDFLCESGIFVDAVGWHFEKDNKAGNYEIETGRKDGGVDIIVTVYFCENDGVDDEDVEKALLFEEE